MEDDLLIQVISVEKEIQARLEAERGKAREWVEQVQREVEEDFQQGEALLRESIARSAEQARAEAKARALMIIKDAEEKADLFLSLDDDILRRIVMRKLKMILME